MSQAGIINVENSNIPGDVPINFYGNTGTGATAVNHNIEIIGVGGVSVDTTGNIISISVSVSGFTWNIVTSATNPNQLVAENGYICNGTSLVTFKLPVSPALGDEFKIIANTALFEIIPNANQQIQVGSVTGVLGATGTVNANSSGDRIICTYVGGNLFVAEPPQGTLTVTTS